MILQYDYTPRIHYLITPENITLKYENFEKNNVRNTYDRLFNFINYNLNEFSQDLINLYTIDLSNKNDFVNCYKKISKHIDAIFGISYADIVNYFLCNDYYDYLSQNDTHNSLSAKKKFINFACSVYMMDVPSTGFLEDNIEQYLISDITDYAFNLYDQKVGQNSSLTGSVNELYPDSTPPCKLRTLQKKFKDYCALYYTPNEYYRLKQKTHINQIEYNQLLQSALKIERYNQSVDSPKKRKEFSFSEKVALNIHTSRKYEIELNGQATLADENMKKPKARRNNEIYQKLLPIYEYNIQLDFSHGLTNPNEISYFFNNLESILILDMFLFLKTTHYICWCSECKKIFHNPHLAFYCQSTCKNKHHSTIKSSCIIWKEYERIRKKISARNKAGNCDIFCYDKYISKLNEILNNYLNGITTEKNAKDRLVEEEITIDIEYKQIKENRKYGI